MSAVLLKLTGGGTVHGIRSPDGTYMFAVYDFIEVVCHKTRKFANNTWSHLKAVDGKLECPKLPYKMDGNENYELGPTLKRRATPVVTMLVLRILGNALGSKVNVDAHHRFEDIFARFMTGDTSMIEEIRPNAVFAARSTRRWHRSPCWRQSVQSVCLITLRSSSTLNSKRDK